jgi:hypothetical protein
VTSQWDALLDQLAAIESASADSPAPPIVNSINQLSAQLGLPGAPGVTLESRLVAILNQLSGQSALLSTTNDRVSAFRDQEANGRDSTHQILGAISVTLEQIRDGINNLSSTPGSAPTPTPTPTPFTPVTLNSGNPFFESTSAVPFSAANFVTVPAGASRIKVSAYGTEMDSLLRLAVEFRRVAGSTAPGDRTFYVCDLATEIATATTGEFASVAWELPVDGPSVRISLQSISGGTAKVYAIAY